MGHNLCVLLSGQIILAKRLTINYSTISINEYRPLFKKLLPAMYCLNVVF